MTQTANPDQVIKVADSTARLSLAPSNGTICIQLDNQSGWVFNAPGNSWTALGGGGSGTPGGPFDSIQYNDAGSFFGDALATRNPITNVTTLGQNYTASNGDAISWEYSLGGTFMGFPLDGAISTDSTISQTNVVGIVDLTTNASGIASVLGLFGTGNIQTTLVASTGALQLQFKDNSSDHGIVNLSPSGSSITFQGPSGHQRGFGSTDSIAFYKNKSGDVNLPDGFGLTGQLVSTDGAGNWVYVNSGGGGAPALPFNSIQYNNSGAFGGSANWTFDGTNVELVSGDFALSANQKLHFNGIGDGIWFMGYAPILSDFPFTPNILNMGGSYITVDGSTPFKGFGLGITGDISLYEVDANQKNHLFNVNDFKISGLTNNNSFELNDTTQAITAVLGTTGNFNVQDTSSNPIIHANSQFRVAVLGDFNGVNNLTSFQVNDSSKSIIAGLNVSGGTFHINDSAGNSWLNVTPSASQVQIGALTGGNLTQFGVFDSVQQIIAQINNGVFYVSDAGNYPFLYINKGTQIYCLGDLAAESNATGVKVDNSSGVVVIGDVFGNNTNFVVNKTLDTLEFGNSLINALQFNIISGTRNGAMGDTTSLNHGTKIAWDDVAQTVTLDATSIVLNTSSSSGTSAGFLNTIPGAGGSPAGYLQMIINGVTSFIPYWQ